MPLGSGSNSQQVKFLNTDPWKGKGASSTLLTKGRDAGDVVKLFKKLSPIKKLVRSNAERGLWSTESKIQMGGHGDAVIGT